MERMPCSLKYLNVTDMWKCHYTGTVECFHLVFLLVRCELRKSGPKMLC